MRITRNKPAEDDDEVLGIPSEQPGVLMMAEIENIGCTPGRVSINRDTGRRMTLIPDHDQLLVTVYDDYHQKQHHLRLSAKQVAAMRDWLAWLCENSADISFKLEMWRLAEARAEQDDE